MRVVKVNISRNNAIGPELYRLDYGTKIELVGLELPYAYEVHLGKSVTQDAIVAIGNASGFIVPDELLLDTGTLFGWLYVHNSSDDGFTKRAFSCVVNNRPNTTDVEPTPVQQDTITEAIAALNAGVEDVHDIIENVQQSIATALQEAKDSGEFDGPQGIQGPPGYTPQRGVDYWTETDVQDMNDTIEEIAGTTILPVVATSGAVVSILDGADDFPIHALVVDVDAGTNQSGYTGCTLHRTGKNLYSGNNVSDTQFAEVSVSPIPAGNYTFSAVVASSDTDATSSLVYFLDSTDNIIGFASMQRSVNGSRVSGAVTLAGECTKMWFYASSGWAEGEGDAFSFTDIQLEHGSEATIYETYQGEVWTINFPSAAGSVTSGILDIINGTLTVNDGGSPVVYTLTPIKVKTLLGQNYIWASTGNVSVEYPADIGLYIDDAIDAHSGVSDVKVNGSSVLVDGTANIPAATTSGYGVVQIGYGLRTVDNRLSVNPAGASDIKGGTSTMLPVTPQRQQEAVYFGLSKAAGVDLANETVTVGTYPDTAKAAIRTMLGAVGDVQVNGTSVVSGGVANIPIADATTFGTIKVDSGLGIGVISSGGNAGKLSLLIATDAQVKQSVGPQSPIPSAKTSMTVFYGLAKAAGDSTQSESSAAVGTYTDAAKSAISQMLNGSVSITGSTPSITALPGIRYICGEVTTLDITLPASGIVDVVFESGSTATTLTITPPTGQTLKWANGFDPTSLDANTTYEINIADGLGVAVGWT